MKMNKQMYIMPSTQNVACLATAPIMQLNSISPNIIPGGGDTGSGGIMPPSI